jgi:hypothetical protein
MSSKGLHKVVASAGNLSRYYFFPLRQERTRSDVQRRHFA